MTFYNTTKESGNELQRSVARARTQQEQILDFFRANHSRLFTPAQVQGQMSWMLLTSVRRAISDLTDAGELVKTIIQQPGAYGKINYCWQYNDRQRDRQMKLFGN